MPDGSELEGLARAALGRGDTLASSAMHAMIRSARATAVPVRRLFAPFAGLLQAPKVLA
jgi:hypothetical protein